MKTIHLLKKLEKLPLFTQNDVAKIINKNPKYVRTLLYRLKRDNLIKGIEKGDRNRPSNSCSYKQPKN